ncbi:MAG: aminomethyl-transferring glycine dehydrogenase [Bacteroidetes bacterium]|nr:aminomethyl-transferring glycine dehydrogenase [Bacteroidota bacterium]
MEKFDLKEKFSDRHIGPTNAELNEMLADIGVDSLNDLIDKTVPKQIRLKEKLKLDLPKTEFEFLNELKVLASKNKIYDSYIGLGYYSTITPSVIIRNILENPGWYTQYTPYQAEISQGRLEALLNFQTMVSDFTGLEIANASLLDEGTAASEAMIMFYNARKKEKKNADVFLVSEECFPQTIDVLKTRAVPLGIEIKIGDHRKFELSDNVFGLLVQYPSGDGQVYDYKDLFNNANASNVFTTVAADLLSLALLKSPGEFGADAAVGTTQRFGVPVAFGGPHAAYFATRDEFKRQIPGRIIGISVDSKDRRALRMALQTREQHIKREKATSNICTAQVLLAIIAGMYAAYHGPSGIKRIARKINNLTQLLAYGLNDLGYTQLNTLYFDTLKIDAGSKDNALKIKTYAESKNINFRYFNEKYIGISLGETASYENVKSILEIFAAADNKTEADINYPSIEGKVNDGIFGDLSRTKDFLTHPVFNSYRSETEMMRYIKSLEKKDLSLTHSMIPLGSCTMKLNAATEMFPITWPEFSQIHPFVPEDQALGYRLLFAELEAQLCEITGFSAVSLQPNSGAQGEYTGLMVIREYHISRGEGHRDVILIPSSAHGTNPASAVMAGGKVIIVKCDEKGNIDINDLKIKAEANKDNLSSIMVTYPSTHGVFEENIKDVCKIIHDNGGQVYMDGANLNAQLGLTHPKEIGADVCHLNLHKTFCIPHGGGGPGMGPIGVAEQLVPFLPGHPVVKIGDGHSMSAVSAAPWGSAGILPISYAYIKMMGEEGLTEATMYAILNANYLKAKLGKEFKVLYSGVNGFAAHELIFDMREFKQSCGIEVEDIAKRLMDYGYHAPTVSFPVPGTLMVEPTESESKAELDQFCEAMLLIKEEITAIENGIYDKEDNPLKNAPHTAQDVISDDWNHSYSREKAAFPTAWTKANKFWPSVGRVNNAYGDRNLVCSCLPIEAYETQGV